MTRIGRTAPCWDGLTDHLGYLRSWLGRKVRDHHELEDVLQETLIRAARYRSTQERGDRLRFWLLRIARNVLNDTIRRTSRAGRTASEDEALQEVLAREAPPGAEEEEDPPVFVGRHRLERSEVLKHMDGAMSELPSLDRRLLESFYGGKSCSVSGEECGVDPKLVKVRLFRARRRLARLLEVRIALETRRELWPTG